MTPLVESDDDYAAIREREREDSRRWAADHIALTPSLWFVLRHSGREGATWRVNFESRDEKEATHFYYRKLPRDPNRAACCTVLTHGGTDRWRDRVRYDGLEPRHAGLGLDGVVKAADAREQREARKAKRERPRVATVARVAEQGLRIAVVTEEEAAEREHEAIEDAGAVERRA